MFFPLCLVCVCLLDHSLPVIKFAASAVAGSAKCEQSAKMSINRDPESLEPTPISRRGRWRGSSGSISSKRSDSKSVPLLEDSYMSLESSLTSSGTNGELQHYARGFSYISTVSEAL